MLLGASNSGAPPIQNCGAVVVGTPGPCRMCATRPGDVEKEEKVFRRCSRCKNADYCSEKCQRDHWPAHKTSCVETRVPFPEREHNAHLLLRRDLQAPFVSPSVIRDFKTEQEQLRLSLMDASLVDPVWRCVCMCLCLCMCVCEWSCVCARVYVETKI